MTSLIYRDPIKDKIKIWKVTNFASRCFVLIPKWSKTLKLFLTTDKNLSIESRWRCANTYFKNFSHVPEIWYKTPGGSVCIQETPRWYKKVALDALRFGSLTMLIRARISTIVFSLLRVNYFQGLNVNSLFSILHSSFCFLFFSICFFLVFLNYYRCYLSMRISGTC